LGGSSADSVQKGLFLFPCLSFWLDQPKALPELTNSIENGKVVRKNETKNQGLATQFKNIHALPVR